MNLSFPVLHSIIRRFGFKLFNESTLIFNPEPIFQKYNNWEIGIIEDDQGIYIILRYLPLNLSYFQYSHPCGFSPMRFAKRVCDEIPLIAKLDIRQPKYE